MARPLVLGLVLHNHQPHGNFDHVLERATERAYAPLLASLWRQPAFRIGLHYSGTLLDWLEAHRPELVDRLAALVARGQVELLTGGYHEPILPVVPRADRLGQVRALSERLADRFGVAPRGLWLTERVWEPGLPADLAAAQVAYTVVDDSHLLLAGVPPDRLDRPYITEDEGRTVALLASRKDLRYRVPWHTVPEVMDWLRAEHRRGAALAFMGDDGEKLGLWPHTYGPVWRDGWWDDFLDAVVGAADWLQTRTPSEALEAIPPAGRVYLPATSYDEMGEWALPPEAARVLHAARREAAAAADPARPFLAGTLWRGFLARYPEANVLHKKMLWVARKVHALPPGANRRAAERWLWAGQSNCPYWHGVFGGVYLMHLRAANWSALAEAERLAETAAGSTRRMGAQVVDWDGDGRAEVVIETASQSAVLLPQDGGTLCCWEDRATGRNALFALARRREADHTLLEAAVAAGEVLVDPAAWSDEPLAVDRDAMVTSIHSEQVRVREAGLEVLVREDPAPRWGLRDRWLPADAGVEDLVESRSPADTGGLLRAAWSLARPPAVREGGVGVGLVAAGPAGGDLADARLSKTLSFDADRPRLVVEYLLDAPGNRSVDGRLAVELTWGLPGGRDGSLTVDPGDQAVDLARPRALADSHGYVYSVAAAGLASRCRIEPSAELWSYPVEVAGRSEAGFERSWQGHSLTVVWPIDVAPGGRWRGTLVLELEPAGPR